MHRLYDRPGAWLVDHPHARRAVAALVAGVTVAVGAAPAVAAHGKTTPGGVHQYGPRPTSVGASTIKE